MKKKWMKYLICLVSLIVIVFGCMIGANAIQNNGGNVKVEMGHVEVEDGKVLTYKLYSPKSATTTNKAPAVLMLHGYQNDHETSAAYAIELARRGVVVMALDEYGHGATNISMIERGYVNHKVTVNYGNDVEGESYLEIGGQKRYKVLINFSNLSFFIDKYSKDNEGNSIKDSSMGGTYAYAYLSTLDYVDGTRMAVSGHSMGTWASWSVAAVFSGLTIAPKAVVLQCGELFSNSVYDSSTIKFNNVLLLQAKYDEFNYFRDYKNVVNDSLLTSELRTNFLGTSTNEAKWNTTYGDFFDGSARRIELLYTNHRLTTHNSKGITTSINWLTNAIGIETNLKPTNQVYHFKELLVLIATLAGVASMMPVMLLVTELPFFKSVRASVPNRESKVKKGWKWWKGAIITMLISGLTYPFLTQLGHGLLPLPETTIFRMTIGNGFLSWYLFLIIIMLITTIMPFVKSKKTDNEIDYVDLGLANEENGVKKKKMDWKLCGKSALLALIMVGFMYLLVVLCESLFMLDFRYIWPFFKSFTGTRFLQFLAYIPIFVVFFVLNNSKIFSQMRNEYATKPGFKGFISCWWRNALCMVGGILFIILIEYIPFFLDLGPGVDLLFSSTFGGPFMSLMIVFVPQVLVFSLICTYLYRKTGNVYTGAFVVAALACWIVTGGSAML